MADSQNRLDEKLVKDRFPKLHGVLFGPVQPFQDQLVWASLFTMAFECLKDFVEENFDSFFSTGFESDSKGGYKNIYPKDFKETKKKYEQVYKDICFRILNGKPNGANAFQIAIAWFYEMEAISDDDFKVISFCNSTRNDLAHELYKWILDDESPVLNKQLIYVPLDQYHKISNWWLINFEASVDPESFEKYSDEDLKSGMSFNVQMLLLIIDRLYPKKETNEEVK